MMYIYLCYIANGKYYCYTNNHIQINMSPPQGSCWRGARGNTRTPSARVVAHATANLRPNIAAFRGFDSSTILIPRGGILASTGDLPESLSQDILVGVMLVGRLGVGSKGELNESRKLLWTKRGNARLILIFSANTNCENMAYRSRICLKGSASKGLSMDHVCVLRRP